MKIMQTADLHLGAKFSKLGGKAPKHRLNQQKTFSKIVDSCVKEKVDALIIAGDLFDKPNPPKKVKGLNVRKRLKIFHMMRKPSLNVFNLLVLPAVLVL